MKWVAGSRLFPIVTRNSRTTISLLMLGLVCNVTEDLESLTVWADRVENIDVNDVFKFGILKLGEPLMGKPDVISQHFLVV